MQDQLNQLNGKVKSLRRDKEDAESEAEGLQKKLKQAKMQIEDAEETSSMLQAQITKMRSAARRAPKVRVHAAEGEPPLLEILIDLYYKSTQLSGL